MGRRLRKHMVIIVLSLIMVVMMTIENIPASNKKVKAADTNYLTFTGEAEFTLSVGPDGKGWDGTMEYSTDAVTWNTWDGSVISSTGTAPYVLYLRGSGNTRISDDNKGFKLEKAKVACSGNIMTLLNYKDPDSATMGEKAFYYLFYKCSNLTSAPELQATTLANSCYSNMFNGCTGLQTAPELQATTLADYCYFAMFEGCTGLQTAPKLPATTLTTSCYSYMFNDCTELQTAPKLPATTLTTSCYSYMFNGCTGLQTAPELPATTLADYCYSNIFKGCMGLQTAPELPATTLADHCYISMFKGCTELQTAPELPATTLANSCYSDMFNGCTGLQTASELPATTLANSCYSDMFNGCTGLQTAPELPATTLTTSCYSNMFKGCTRLQTAPELPATTLADFCYYYMFYGCTGIRISDKKGTFDGVTYGKEYRIPSANDGKDAVRSTTDMFSRTGGKFKGTPDINTTYYLATKDDKNCLTFTGEAEFTLSVSEKGWDGTMEYSTDAIKWNTWDGSVISSTGTAPYVLYIRGSGNTQVSALCKSFKLEKAKVACSGNVMTLLDYEHAETYDKVPASAFNNLFRDCRNLTSAPELPAKYLSIECYHEMFLGCTGLKNAPELPATNLAPACYDGMFENCTGLEKAPELPATTLDDSCYSYMFEGCTGLKNIPELPAINLQRWCYLFMFKGCTGICISDQKGTFDGVTYGKEYRIPSENTGTDANKSTYDMFSDTGGQFKGTPSINKTYYLPVKLMTASVDDTTVDYDGAPHGITVSVTEPTVGATIKYGLTEGTYDLDECPTIINVAESPRIIYYQITADEYADVTGSAKVTINPIAPVTPTGIKAAYGQTLADIDLPSGWAWYDDTESVGNVGTNKFKANYTSTDKNYISVSNVEISIEVGKVVNKVTTAPTGKTLDYSGSAQELIEAGQASVGKMLYAIGDKNGPTETYSETIPAKTEAGTYYIWYKAGADENHNESEAGYVTSKIRAAVKHTVTFKVVNGSWNNGDLDDVTVDLTGFEGDTLKLSADQIPLVGTKPDSDHKKGKWDVTPNIATEITGDTTYTYTYADKKMIKYTVTFKVENGEWDDGGSEDKVVTLSREEAEDLLLLLKNEDIPAVGNKPSNGFKAGGWDIAPRTDMVISEDKTYIYTYAQKAPTSQTVTFKVANGTWNDGTTEDKTVTLTGYEGEALKLAAGDIPAVGDKPDTDYKKGSWNTVPSTDTEITADTEYTYTYAHKDSIAKTVTFKVENGSWSDGSTDDIKVTLTGLEGDTLKLAAGDIPAVGDKPEKNYKEGSWDTVPSTDTEITADTTYTYKYVGKTAVSNTVTFKVANGSWDDGTTEDKTVVLSGYEGDTLKLAAGDIPAVGDKPETNHKKGSWNTVPSTDTEITADTEYTYTYAEKSIVSHTVTFKVENGSWNDGTSDDVTVTLSGYEDETLKLADGQIPAAGAMPGENKKEGNWDTIPDTETAITDDITCTYSYIDKDAISVKVTFKVINGSWNDGTALDKVITLSGYEGDVLKLTSDQIPVAGDKPFDTYKAGGWDTVPEADTELTADVTYTYSYTEKDTVTYTATFKVENGTWNDGTTDDITLTLTGYEGDTLKFTSDDIPEAGEKPAETYKAGGWDTAFSSENVLTGDATYTYTYKEKSKISQTVTFKVVNGSWNDGTTEDRIVTLSGYEGDIQKLSADLIPAAGSKPKDGFTEGTWDSVPDTENEVTLDKVYTYTYAEKIEVIKPEYYIENGADGNVTEGEEIEVEITAKRSIDDEHCIDHHQKVEFGGVVLTKDKDYTIKKGSTIVTIKGSFIKNLKPGVYTINVIFDDGAVSTKLTVKEKTTESNTEATTEATTEAAQKPAEKKTDKNAATGDDINIWIALMALSMSGITAVLMSEKKKRNK